MPGVESQIAVQLHHRPLGPHINAASAEANRPSSPFALLVDGADEASSQPAQGQTDRVQPNPPPRTSPVNESRLDRLTPPTLAIPDAGQPSATIAVTQLAESPQVAEGQAAAPELIPGAIPPPTPVIAQLAPTDVAAADVNVAELPVVPVAADKIGNGDHQDADNKDGDTTDNSGETGQVMVANGDANAVPPIPVQPVAVAAPAPAPAMLALQTTSPDTGGTAQPLSEADRATPATPDALQAGQAEPKSATGPNVPNGSSGLPQPQAANAAESSPIATTAPSDGDAPASPEQVAQHAASPSQPQEKAKLAHVVAGAIDRLAAQKSGDVLNPRATSADVLAPNGGSSPNGTDVANLQQTADRLVNATASTAQTVSADATPAAGVAYVDGVCAGLAVAIAARAQAGRNHFEIRLDPPELGRIDVQLDVDRNGQVTSRILVDKAETFDALRRDAGDLERALQQAGLKTADNGLQFALRDQSFAGRNDGGGTMPSPARLVVPDPDLVPIETAPNGYGRMPRAGGIDIRV